MYNSDTHLLRDTTIRYSGSIVDVVKYLRIVTRALTEVGYSVLESFQYNKLSYYTLPIRYYIIITIVVVIIIIALRPAISKYWHVDFQH